MLGDVANYRKNNPKVLEIPFNSSNKYQLSIHEIREEFHCEEVGKNGQKEKAGKFGGWQ